MEELIVDSFAGGGGGASTGIEMALGLPACGVSAHRHVVMFSAGGGSWAAAKRVVAEHGPAAATLVFTDTLSEDEDAYRFLIEGAANVFGVDLPTQFLPDLAAFPDYEDRAAYKLFVTGLRLEVEASGLLPGLVWIADGRDIWDVFFDERFLGNSRADPCSKILKRQLASRWLDLNCDPARTTVHIGIDFTESHRFDDGEGGGVRPRRAAKGWTYESPLLSAPWLMKPDVLRWMRAQGLRPPRLYADGHPHNNCGGWCIKMGHAQAGLLLRTNPRRYAGHEAREQDIRGFLGKDVSVLTDRAGGDGKNPLTLADFRRRIEARPQMALDFDDWGGCGCMLEAAE
jgi:hypothetical protein